MHFKGLRDEDPSRELKVVGVGQYCTRNVGKIKRRSKQVVVEGRLRMNSVTRQDGTKEKQAELTASRIHQISPAREINTDKDEPNTSKATIAILLKKIWKY